MQIVQRRDRSAGFSLIEMVVVVVVLAILAMIAIPSYQGAMRKSRRAEGKILLQTFMAAEERHYSRSNRYTDAPSDLGLEASVESEPGKYYLVAQVSLGGEGQSVTVTVEPRQVQSGDVCGSLSLDSLGHRSASGAAANASECW